MFWYLMQIYGKINVPLYGGLFMDFDKIFEIMDEAFPNNEMRTYEEQKKLLSNERYHIYKEYSNGKIIGFLAYWDLENCLFLEHLAVDKNFRGHGTGANIILNNIKNVNKPVFLEVELPTTDLAARRINFYKRLGFFLNEFTYVQPALRKNEKSQNLFIMSYKKPISEQEFIKYKNEIYKNVYNLTSKEI